MENLSLVEVSAKSISKKSLLELLFKSIGLGFIAFSLLMGILSIFGLETVSWNEEPVSGFIGLLASMFVGLFLSVFFTIFLWLVGILGLWINAMFGGVTIVFKNVTSKVKIKRVTT